MTHVILGTSRYPMFNIVTELDRNRKPRQVDGLDALAAFTPVEYIGAIKGTVWVTISDQVVFERLPLAPRQRTDAVVEYWNRTIRPARRVLLRRARRRGLSVAAATSIVSAGVGLAIGSVSSPAPVAPWRLPEKYPAGAVLAAPA